MVFFAEASLSALLRCGVFDAEGKEIGQITDVVVHLEPASQSTTGPPHDR